MLKDSYSALWVSHSSINDFLKCPRLYYLRNIYRDPATGNRINVIQPPLALGQAVHDTIDFLSNLPAEERQKIPLLSKFESFWEGVAGKKGGFRNIAQEDEYRDRGKAMIQRIVNNPKIISNKAIKIKSEDHLPPRFLFSNEENIILCGKIDWLEYLAKNDSVHIIDFKTGKWEEDSESLQLPIYYILASNLQSRKVEKASYWYLDKENEPTEISLPDPEKAKDDILEIAKRIKLARQIEHFKCPKNGCRYCTPFEQASKGGATLVGVSDYQDIYAIIS